jgi:hypothetical protein
MIKGKRVYLDDLVEAPYISQGTGEVYIAINKTYGCIEKPFFVICRGVAVVGIKYKDSGREAFRSAGDLGLAPYPSGNWNTHNTTHKVDLSTWQDDWM